MAIDNPKPDIRDILYINFDLVRSGGNEPFRVISNNIGREEGIRDVGTFSFKISTAFCVPCSRPS